MKKTDDLKNKLAATFTERNNWNKRIEIDAAVQDQIPVSTLKKARS